MNAHPDVLAFLESLGADGEGICSADSVRTSTVSHPDGTVLTYEVVEKECTGTSGQIEFKGKLVEIENGDVFFDRRFRRKITTKGVKQLVLKIENGVLKINNETMNF